MNCTEFERDVNERLDARQTALSAVMRDHLAGCPGCQAFWRGQQALLAAVGSWKELAPSGRSIAGALRELTKQNDGAPLPQASSSLTRTDRSGLWGLVCSTAALTLFAVLIVRSPAPDPVRPLPVAQQEPAAPAETENVSDALSGLLRGVRSEYAEMSRETTRVLADLGDLPEAGAWLAPIAAGDDAEPQAASPWMRLDRPVSERVAQAFDFLWDALPRETPPLSSGSL
jgi:hypothetical protein